MHNQTFLILLPTVVIKLVEAPEGSERSETDGVGEEDLCPCINPNLKNSVTEFSKKYPAIKPDGLHIRKVFRSGPIRASVFYVENSST